MITNTEIYHSLMKNGLTQKEANRAFIEHGGHINKMKAVIDKDPSTKEKNLLAMAKSFKVVFSDNPSKALEMAILGKAV